VPLRRISVGLILLTIALVPLGGCANSPLGKQLEQSLAADPQLQGSPSPSFSPSVDPSPTPTVTPSPVATPTISPRVVQSPSPVLTPSPTIAPPLTPSPTTFADLDKAPAELRPAISALAELGVLTPATNSKGMVKDASQFAPNQLITRREFARWLVATNNRLYQDRTAQQIRLGVDSSPPAFRDVPRTDADFGAIQGLAEAGIVPSSLSGDPAIATFRPDQPLTREQLLLWKVPLDHRQGLPSASTEAIKQTWGFQDASRIDPIALRAVLADYQNGDQANIRRAFGYTTLFQPKKAVSRAEAAAALAYFGSQGEGISAQEALKPRTS